MKNKRIFMLMFIVGLFAVMMFMNPNEVHAATTYNTNFDFVKVTEIQRWTPENDLIYRKVENWGGDSTWYTKEVYLSNTATPDFSTNSWQLMEITDNGDTFYNEGSDYEGQTLYLIEKYTINLTSVGDSLAVGETNIAGYIPTGDYLDFNFNNTTIKTNSTINYIKNESSNSYQACVEKLFTSGTADTENRDTTVYAYVKNSSEAKVTSASRGSIVLPIFNLKVSMSASGNMVPAGHFAIHFARDDQYWGNDIDANTSTSSLGSASGYFLKKDYCSSLTYDYFSNPVYDVYYRWSNNEPDIYGKSYSNIGNWNQYELNSSEYTVSEIEEDTGNNTYYRTVSATLNWNKTAPNGIFYNILPFAIAGILAVAGIALLKKNSIKE